MRVVIAHGLISFQGSGAVLMHMHRCPSARSGVAKRKGAWPGGGSPGLHKRSAESRGNPATRRSFTLARREGQSPLEHSRKAGAHGGAVYTVRSRLLLKADGVEHGPRRFASYAKREHRRRTGRHYRLESPVVPNVAHTLGFADRLDSRQRPVPINNLSQPGLHYIWL